MTVYIDPPRWPAHGTRWSHLISDIDAEELHAVARSIGLPRRAFDLDHYDVPEARYAAAVEAGAHAVPTRELVKRLAAAGLRVRPAERAEAAARRRIEWLHASWASLAEPLAVSQLDTWATVGDEVLERWTEPHRRYHDATHLHDVLLALDDLADRGMRVGPETRLAAWFHDAVYAGEPGTDECASAALARERLNALSLEASVVDEVARFVLATLPGTETAPGDAAASLLDADLAILAAGERRYRAYATGVRAEYVHVPDAEFRPARARILQTYLDRPAIYLTPAGRDLWEERARRNLADEVAQLLA